METHHSWVLAHPMSLRHCRGGAWALHLSHEGGPGDRRGSEGSRKLPLIVSARGGHPFLGGFQGKPRGKPHNLGISFKKMTPTCMWHLRLSFLTHESRPFGWQRIREEPTHLLGSSFLLVKHLADLLSSCSVVFSSRSSHLVACLGRGSSGHSLQWFRFTLNTLSFLARSRNTLLPENRL